MSGWLGDSNFVNLGKTADCKTVRIFAYSARAVKQKVWNDSLLILRKKPTVLQASKTVVFHSFMI